MKKRYSIRDSEHEIYYEFYIKFQLESAILNSGSQHIPDSNTILFDKQNMEIEIIRRKGNDEGKYFTKGETIIAYLPLVRMRLAEIAKKFIDYQKQRVNQGFEKPILYPPELLEPKLKYEAQEDVLNGEVEILEKKLKELSEVVQKRDDSMVLLYGLKGMGKLTGGILTRLDGQDVQFINGVLCILDERSKYNGMSVVDYRKLMVIWKENEQKRYQENLQKAREIAKEEGRPLPSMLGSKPNWKQSELPDFPDWAENHLLKEKE